MHRAENAAWVAGTLLLWMFAALAVEKFQTYRALRRLDRNRP